MIAIQASRLLQLFRGCFFLATSMLVAGAANAASPKISFLNTSVDFGRVAQGQELTYRFHFQNIGTANLQIVGSYASCGCTSVESATQTYRPQEKGHIDVHFKTASFTGPTQKVVAVLTNEALAPQHLLTLRADISSDYLVDKPILDFGALPLGTTKELEVLLSPQDGFALTLEQVEAAPQYFQVESSPVGKLWQVKVKLQPQERKGNFRERIRLVTNSSHLPTFDVYAIGQITGPISSEPTYLEFGAIEKNGQAKRLLHLSSRDAFRITGERVRLHLNGVEISGSEQPLKWQETREPQGVAIELTLANPATTAGSVSGRIVFETSNSGQDQIPVDVYGFFL